LVKTNLKNREPSLKSKYNNIIDSELVPWGKCEKEPLSVEWKDLEILLFKSSKRNFIL